MSMIVALSLLLGVQLSTCARFDDVPVPHLVSDDYQIWIAVAKSRPSWLAPRECEFGGLHRPTGCHGSLRTRTRRVVGDRGRLRKAFRSLQDVKSPCFVCTVDEKILFKCQTDISRGIVVPSSLLAL